MDGVCASQGQFCRCGAWQGGYGAEPTPEMYVEHTVEVLRAIRRVLKPSGVVWLNLGDSYANDAKWGGATGGKHANGLHGASAIGRQKTTTGLKSKDMCLIPQRVAIAAQADGWWVRSDVIWAKPNPMPESVTDRPTKAHEYVFLLTKSEWYFWDQDAVREEASPASIARISQPTFAQQTGGPKDYANGTNPSRSARKALENFAENPGRNIRSVWTIPTQPSNLAMRTVRRELVAADAADGDTKRITSADCPLHGSPDAAPSDGEREGHQSSRTEHIDGRHASSLPGDSASILDPSGAGEDGIQARAEKRRNTQTRRTGLVPATNQPCMPSAETGGHTDGRSKSRAFSGPQQNISESNSAQDARGVRSPDRSPDRTAGIASCTCSYYRETESIIQHFAAFPEELAERCIKAACPSEVCTRCGTPRTRIVERVPGKSRSGPKTTAAHHARGGTGEPVGTVGKSGGGRIDGTSRTIGWWDCGCGARFAPGVVLDPFAGTGTTLLVSERMFRRSIGIEISQDYIEIMRERLRVGTSRAALVLKARDAVDPDDIPLMRGLD